MWWYDQALICDAGDHDCNKHMLHTEGFEYADQRGVHLSADMRSERRRYNAWAYWWKQEGYPKLTTVGPHLPRAARRVYGATDTIITTEYIVPPGNQKRQWVVVDRPA